MNRIIKFRAWGKESKKMFYSNDSVPMAENYSKFLLSLDGELTRVFCHKLRATKYGYDWYDMPWDAKEYELMQFTGLLDCKGREIFEGDILNHHIFGINEVIWKASAFWTKEVRQRQPQEPKSTLGFPDEQYEIIGNVWENPELTSEGNGEQ